MITKQIALKDGDMVWILSKDQAMGLLGVLDALVELNEMKGVGYGFYKESADHLAQTIRDHGHEVLRMKDIR